MKKQININSKPLALQSGLKEYGFEKFLKIGIQKVVSDENLIPVNPLESFYNSGYIDTNGNFYGCDDKVHKIFSEKICKKLKISDKSNDYERFLDEKGWIKVSHQCFFWLSTHFMINKRQQSTILKLMRRFGVNESIFNRLDSKITLLEALKYNKNCKLFNN